MSHLPADLTDVLRSARCVAVLTGAGISAESGVPTFRDAQTGLWAKYDPTELATPEAFARDPRLVWEWYAWRRELCAAAKPNAGHLALVELEKLFDDFTLTTQNVDGLHLLAGSRRVLELHGSIRRYKCFDTGRPLEGEPPPCDDPPPRHPDTGGMLRPDVVWFGEALPEAALMESIRAAREADVYFTIGTSALVYPAASLPIEAQRAGATVVEINPTETPFSKIATFSLRGKAGEVLPAILQALDQ
ncbi:MAG: NAD-dependent deacylase [Planctomycetes bacterium]|nr:NAD-dependent deacylase [Planctomycetota bacterium]